MNGYGVFPGLVNSVAYQLQCSINFCAMFLFLNLQKKYIVWVHFGQATNSVCCAIA